jgi:hypothetical protein
MRYLVQLIIPAVIIFVTVFFLLRNRKAVHDPEDKPDVATASGDIGTFILILVVGATVAIIAFVALGEFAP